MVFLTVMMPVLMIQRRPPTLASVAVVLLMLLLVFVLVLEPLPSLQLVNVTLVTVVATCLILTRTPMAPRIVMTIALLIPPRLSRALAVVARLISILTVMVL
jgi:hypothetical protein